MTHVFMQLVVGLILNGLKTCLMHLVKFESFVGFGQIIL